MRWISEYQLELSLAYNSLFQRKMTPFLGSIYTLKQLIEKHKILFKGTFYEKNPRLIYNFGEIHADYISMSIGVLYLLMLPRIMHMEYPLYCVYPYFQLKNKEWWSTAEK